MMKRVVFVAAILACFAVSAFAGDLSIKPNKAALDKQDLKRDFIADKALSPKSSPKAVDLLNEGFESGTIPAGWTVVNGNADAVQFTIVDYTTGAYDPISNNPGTYFAQYNDDAAGVSAATIEELITPSIATPGAFWTTISYDYNMQDFGGLGYFETHVRTFNGSWSGWTTLVNHTVDQISSDTLSLDSYDDNDSLQIRILFNDEGEWGWGMGIDNIVIQYEPVPTDSNDMTVESFINPQLVISPMSFNPEIEIYNNGFKDQFGGMNLYCWIYSKDSVLLYADTLQITDTIYTFTYDTFEMAKSFTPSYLSEYYIVSEIDLPADTLHYNDTQSFDFRTHDLEVALSNFICPSASMNYVLDYPVSVDVTNNGTMTADFDVRLVIENNGTEIFNGTVYVADLTNGSTSTVSFPLFSAPHDVGEYTFTAFSEMTADYDRSNDTLSSVSMCALNWEDVGNYLTARLIPGVCAYDDGFFVVGGLNSSGYAIISDVQFYSPDSGWNLVTTLPTAVCGASCAIIDNKLYVVGGTLDSSFGTTVNYVQIYDIAGNSWSSGTAMPTSLFAFGGGYSNGKIYVVGGSMNSAFPSYCYNYVYTAAADTIGGTPWDTIAPCPRGTSGLILGANPTANDLDSLIMVGGDYRGTTYGYYIYNINQNTWTTITTPPTTVGGQNPGLFWDGDKFILAGGCVTGGWGAGSVQTFFYDVQSDTWSNSGYKLINPNYAFAPAVLANGYMQASGGFFNTLVHERTGSAFNSYDTKAPFINFTYPTHKSTSVPLWRTIVVGFSEKIDTSIGFNFDVNPDPGLLLGVWNSTQDTLKIFHEDFRYNTTYYVTLNSVYDTMGYPLKTSSVPNPFGFSTGLTGVNSKNMLVGKTMLEIPAMNVTNSFVRFDYSVENETEVKMEVYSLNGSMVRTIVNARVSSGTHKVIFDLKDNSGKTLPSGTYVYRFTAGKYSASGKLTVIK
ncbi:MAG: Ig-like domain-containing protein [bacterium]|nr:Ig-like domain-containing protein [bacterium]